MTMNKIFYFFFIFTEPSADTETMHQNVCRVEAPPTSPRSLDPAYAKVAFLIFKPIVFRKGKKCVYKTKSLFARRRCK